MKHAQLLWRLHLDMWHYAACAAEEIAAHLGVIDTALVAGFQWKQGPFAQWQAAGFCVRGARGG